VLAQREQAEDPRVANLALVRSMEIHDRLTKVALGGEGQAGIAQAVCELTGRPAASRTASATCWRGPVPGSGTSRILPGRTSA
jgi:hypothetical protein